MNYAFLFFFTKNAFMMCVCSTLNQINTTANQGTFAVESEMLYCTH